MMGWQWHQLHHTQIICTLLQINNHAITQFLQARCSSWCPTRACERSGGSRISACCSNLFLWLLLPAPWPPAPANFFTPTHHSAPAHQIFGPLCSRSLQCL